MIYLDSNVLVSLFIDDSNTGSAKTWYVAQSGPFALSRLTVVEFLAVTGLLKRRAALKPATAKVTIAAFEAEVDRSFVILPIDDGVWDLVASWLRDPDCALRAADALHLAVAVRSGSSHIVTFDERFARAARKLRSVPPEVLLLAGEDSGGVRVKQPRASYRAKRRKAN